MEFTIGDTFRTSVNKSFPMSDGTIMNLES